MLEEVIPVAFLPGGWMAVETAKHPNLAQKDTALIRELTVVLTSSSPPFVGNLGSLHCFAEIGPCFHWFPVWAHLTSFFFMPLCACKKKLNTDKFNGQTLLRGIREIREVS